MEIEIWSDVVCPWCYIGKRRFEAAMADYGAEFEITWRSFELNPHANKRVQGNLDHILAKKYGVSVERARAMMDRVVEEASAVGLRFDFDRAISGNTFDAHRLIHFAADRAGEMSERLMSAYFCDGRDITSHDDLAALAAEVGLDEGSAYEALATGAFADAVRQDEATARARGIHSVPTFLINGSYPIPGAQPVETFRAVFDQLAARAGATT